MILKITYFILLSLIIIIYCKNDYILSSGSFTDKKEYYFKGELTFLSSNFKPEDYNITFQNKTTLYPIKNLSLEINLQCNEIVNIKITDKNNKRWEPLFTPNQLYKEKIKKCENKISLKDYGLNFTTLINKTFNFKLTKNKKTIINSEQSNFLFSEYFILFGYYLTSNDIYGFGERYHNFKLGDGLFTSWPNDTGGIHKDLGNGGHNLMGIHPIGLHKTSNGKFIGIYFNNINAQDTFIHSNDNKTLLEHRTIGGLIDYYFIYGDNPDDVLIKLHDIIGQPIMPPFWSFGFHLCKWGYNNTNEIRELYNKFFDQNLPIDTFWVDIDVLEDKRIFSLNMEDFPDLPDFIKTLHDNNYKFIPIVDIGFPINDSDPYYIRGHETNAFILSNYTKKELVSIVWPGEACFPDFFTNAGMDLWHYAMENYYEIIKYDGIWIDMNEPAMLYSLESMRGEILEQYDPIYNKYEYIPYIPGFRIDDKDRVNDRCDIRSHSLSENAISVSTVDNPLLDSYNFKPHLSVLQAKATNDYLTKLEKRPFIISRSTSPGLNQYGFHWLGDNNADVNSMRNGITGIFNFQIFGIPMTGDDICGFGSNSTDNLCARWMALGLFFPFSRNHNSKNNIPQDPFAFGYNSKTLKVSRIVIRYRYSLLRYFYSQMFKISLGESGSFFKPLFFNFPNDNNTYDNIDSNAMIGDAFYLIPNFNIDDNIKDIESYFPNANWNYFPLFTSFINFDKNKESGSKINLKGDYDKIHLFMRGGFIIPYQDTFSTSIKNSRDLRNHPTQIIINPDENYNAEGEVIFDDDDYSTFTTKNYLKVKMSFHYNIINFYIVNNFIDDYLYHDNKISLIKFLRMDYLIKNGKYNMINIITHNHKFYNIKLKSKGNDIYECDISKLNLRFDDISSVIIYENVPKKKLKFLS